MKAFSVFTFIALLSLVFAGCPMPQDREEIMLLAADSTDYEKVKAEITDGIRALFSQMAADSVSINSLRVVYDGIEIKQKLKSLKPPDTIKATVTHPVTLE